MSALVDAKNEVKAEIARTDTKASLLLAFDLGGLAGVWTAGSQPWVPAGARVVGGLAVLALLASVVVLLLVVRPRISPTAHRAGFPHWAGLSPELRAELGADQRAAHVTGRTAEHVVALSGIAVAKMRGVQTAVNWTLVTGAPLFVATLVTARGAL